MNSTTQAATARTPPSSEYLPYLGLAFVAMSGLAYINFLPGLVNALAGGIGLAEAQAGKVVALNGYGGIAGSIVAVFLVRRIPWQRVLRLALTVLMLVDVATIWIADYSIMLGWRLLAGLVGGLCIGVAFSVLARLNNPDRAFGLLLFVQFTIGSVVIYLLPWLEAVIDAYAVFYVMACMSLLSLLFLLILGDPTTHKHTDTENAFGLRISFSAWLLLLSMLTYQTAASSIWAYVGLIGLAAGMSNQAVSMYIASTGLLGLAGALLPVISGSRFGRLYWVLGGTALSALAAMMIGFAVITPLYVAGMCLLFFCWPAVQSYLLAVSAAMDKSGQLSTIAGVVTSIGLASGPLLASNLLVTDDYSIMLFSSAIIFIISAGAAIKPVNDADMQADLASGYSPIAPTNRANE